MGEHPSTNTKIESVPRLYPPFQRIDRTVMEKRNIWTHMERVGDPYYGQMCDTHSVDTRKEEPVRLITFEYEGEYVSLYAGDLFCFNPVKYTSKPRKNEERNLVQSKRL